MSGNVCSWREINAWKAHHGGSVLTPPEHGKVVHSDRNVVEVVFPASFAGSSLGTHAHPEGNDIFTKARWVLLHLDVTEAYEHYRDMVTQKIILISSW